MGRRQNKISAFKVFKGRNGKNNTFEQIKSSKPEIKARAIGRSKKKNDGFLDEEGIMSVETTRRSRRKSEEMCNKDVELVDVKRKRKHGCESEESSMKADVVTKDVSHSKSLKSDQKKNKNTSVHKKIQGSVSSAHCITNYTLKSVSKKTKECKKIRKTRIISETDSFQNKHAKGLSNASVKRKHKEDRLSQQNVDNKQTVEPSPENKKIRSSSRIMSTTNSSSPVQIIAGQRACRVKKTVSIQMPENCEIDPTDTDASSDDNAPMVPEIIDVDLMELSVVQTQDESKKDGGKIVSKKFKKSKRISDGHASELSKEGKCSLISKWKLISRTTDDKELKCDFPLCLDLTAYTSKHKKDQSVINSDLTLTKLSKSQGDQIISNSVNEPDSSNDSSTYQSENETELSISKQFNSKHLKRKAVKETETLSDSNCSSTEGQDGQEDRATPLNTGEKTCSKRRILTFKTKDSGVLLLLSHPQTICLQGRALVKALHGSVRVMQYDITTNTPACKIFSPSSNSLLTLETTSGARLTMLTPDIVDHSSDTSSLHEFGHRTDELFSLLKINSIDSASFDYVSSIAPYTKLFTLNLDGHTSYNKVLKSVGLAVAVPDMIKLSVLSLSDECTHSIDKWVDMIKLSDQAPIVMVCAGKNCGKSTTGRMLVNAALSVTKEVCFLECDVGQSELTPSGCISLHKLTEPLLGPPFTHQREALRTCYFGGLSPSDNPDLYVTQLEHVYEFYQKMQPSVPLVVNTMGWTEGLGLCLLIDTIHITTPTLVIQLDSSSTLNNFKPLSPEYVVQEPGWCFSKKAISHNGGPKHELLRFNSLSDNMQSVILNWKPLDYRNMSLLAYLSACLEPGMSLNSMTPYTVPWSAVGIHICHYIVKPSQVFCALNASVVALCEADISQAHRPSEDFPWFFDNLPDCRYLGLGIVRGIDMQAKELYIITPLPYEKLRHVNTILKGKNTIPDNVLIGQKSASIIPYVDNVVMTKTAAKFRSRRIVRR